MKAEAAVIRAVIGSDSGESERTVQNPVTVTSCFRGVRGSFQHEGYTSIVSFLYLSGAVANPGAVYRSEERRVGKECRSRWSPYH